LTVLYIHHQNKSKKTKGKGGLSSWMHSSSSKHHFVLSSSVSSAANLESKNNLLHVPIFYFNARSFHYWFDGVREHE
jgi:hypothetical protein